MLTFSSGLFTFLIIVSSYTIVYVFILLLNKSSVDSRHRSHKGLNTRPNRLMLATTLVMYFVAAVKWTLCFAIVWGDFVRVLPRTLALGAANASVAAARFKLDELIYASQVMIVINVSVAAGSCSVLS